MRAHQQPVSALISNSSNEQGLDISKSAEPLILGAYKAATISATGGHKWQPTYSR
jgi:hypothetical protein